MNDVPIVFCDSVCAISERSSLDSISPVLTSSWGASAAKSLNDRVPVCLSLSHSRNAWSYSIGKWTDWPRGRQFMSFAALKRIDRRHLQVVSVVLASTPGEHHHPSSLEEIFQIVHFTLPFLIRPNLTTYSNPEFPGDVFDSLLSLYQEKRFNGLLLESDNRAQNEFLKLQLLGDDLQHVLLRGMTWTSDVRLAIEEFVLTKPFITAHCNYYVSTKLFFEQLFAKPLVGKNSVIRAGFSFDLQELYEFKEDIQDPAGKENSEDQLRIVWKRDDAVRITAHSSQDIFHSDSNEAFKILSLRFQTER